MLIAIFIFFIGLILYVYVGYPLLILLLAMFRRRKVHSDDAFEPTVSLIVAAYNEEQTIAAKLKNCLELDYPRHKLELIVFSDASTDRTDEIVKGYEKDGIILLSLTERSGKTAGQNLAVTRAQGEIIVFSDANAYWRPDAVRKIVRNFHDPSVGCVCGELIYFSRDKTLIGDAEGVYWSYEKLLKRLEDRAASILGANGSIYALRKALYVPLPEDIISDFIEPLKIIEQGYRTIYEPAAISYEPPTTNFAEEYQRKKRIINRSFYALLYYRSLLNPIKHLVLSWQLVSHKILRWLIPFYLPIIFVVNLLLIESAFFQLTLALQILFYLTAWLGFWLERMRWHQVLFYAPFYYCLVNLAALEAIVSFFIKRQKFVIWNPIRTKHTSNAQSD